jgi:hypothetical protein
MGLKDANVASNAGGGSGTAANTANQFESPPRLPTIGRGDLSSRKSTARMNFNNVNPGTGLPGH